ncbi:hypothetical protein AGLY_017874 [Aphis glycines]|uniref:Uncharacterized protein n=1 Tax=Aphis glycines TaxID=307491 RepID=A0A6G0STN0_APHGL|nr:hypothetical protein AGLY_017874 [Aphis glycines]
MFISNDSDKDVSYEPFKKSLSSDKKHKLESVEKQVAGIQEELQTLEAKLINRDQNYEYRSQHKLLKLHNQWYKTFQNSLNMMKKLFKRQQIVRQKFKRQQIARRQFIPLHKPVQSLSRGVTTTFGLAKTHESAQATFVKEKDLSFKKNVFQYLSIQDFQGNREHISRPNNLTHFFGKLTYLVNPCYIGVHLSRELRVKTFEELQVAIRYCTFWHVGSVCSYAGMMWIDPLPEIFF